MKKSKEKKPTASASEKEQDNRPPAVEYVHTQGVPEFFRRLRISLIVSTYQAQRILAFSCTSEKMSMLMRIFERPTGLAIRKRQMALVTKRQVWLLDAPLNIADLDGKQLPYDISFTPRMSFVTGDIAGHEIGWLGDAVVMLCTRFSCLGRPSPDYSFVPIWKPHFISRISPDDRCHLNGMAIENNMLRYVTALGETDEPEGWRDTKRDGGVLVDVQRNAILARKMSMPHSPRLYANRLWVLESGRGELQVVDRQTGVREAIGRFPGYTRGLAFYDRFAFIGLSKIREKDTFGGLPIEEQGIDLECGIQILDLQSGTSVGHLTFTKGIEELFDIQVLPGFVSPHVVGFEEDTVDGLYTLPPGAV